MAKLDPDDLVKSKKVPRFDALCTMIEQHGFKLRNTGGSHFVASHKDRQCSDIFFNIVKDSQDIVYHKNAARACIKARERLEQTLSDTPFDNTKPQPIAPETNIDSNEAIPEHLRVTRQKGQIIVRLRDNPEIGLLYPMNEGDNLVEVVKMVDGLLHEQATEYLERLDRFCKKWEIELVRDAQTQALTIYSPHIYEASLSLYQYNPSASITPTIALEQFEDYIEQLYTLFQKTIEDIKDLPQIQNWTTTRTEDDQIKQQFEIVNTTLGLGHRADYLDTGQVGINAASFFRMLNFITEALFPPDTRKILAELYGVSAHRKADGRIQLKQDCFGFETIIPHTIEPNDIAQSTAKKIKDGLKDGSLDFLQAYTEAVADFQKTVDTHNTIDKFIISINEYVEKEKLLERFAKNAKTLKTKGFIQKPVKKPTPGQTINLCFFNKETDQDINIKVLVLRSTTGENIYVTSLANLKKMEHFIQMIDNRQSSALQIFSFAFTGARNGNGMSEKAVTDPLDAAVRKSMARKAAP